MTERNLLKDITPEELDRLDPTGTLIKKFSLPDSSNGLTFAQQTFLCTFKDGELIAIEDQKNGAIYRWSTEKANRGASLAIFGVDKAERLHESNK